MDALGLSDFGRSVDAVPDSVKELWTPALGARGGGAQILATSSPTNRQQQAYTGATPGWTPSTTASDSPVPGLAHLPPHGSLPPLPPSHYLSDGETCPPLDATSFLKTRTQMLNLRSRLLGEPNLLRIIAQESPDAARHKSTLAPQPSTLSSSHGGGVPLCASTLAPAPPRGRPTPPGTPTGGAQAGSFLLGLVQKGQTSPKGAKQGAEILGLVKGAAQDRNGTSWHEASWSQSAQPWNRHAQIRKNANVQRQST